MELRSGSLTFPSLSGGGPQTATQALVFPRGVLQATAGLTGYSIGYTSPDDHHVGLLQVQLDATLNANVVIVDGSMGVRDWSGNWDDRYQGTIEFIVAADLVSPTAPPPRGDLIVTGVELTQCIQSFRSAQLLDAPNVRPDNSIPLFARKPTGVRVYVDYEGASGLPPITSLAGQLVVTTSIGSTTITLGPVANISPRRDSQIDRRQAGHTLNFVIPEAWCQGQLDLRCQVFDAFDSTQVSPYFDETARFTNVAPLRLYGVGVHYLGQGKDLPAPTQAQVLSTMSFVEKTYPIGEVFLTGYSAYDFDKDMKANIADGCGDGFNSLLDDLRDMRGSSTDIYYAILPPGIDSGSVGGCGGGGVGAGFIGGGATAAQEIGHAFGRDHAPCDSAMRCDNPANQDSNYPKYNSYPSDSIGEVGYDPATNAVFDPASTFDFMGYSGPDWVGPYTYLGLMGQFPASGGPGSSGSSAQALSMLRSLYDGSGGGRSQSEGRAEWIPMEIDLLYLGLEIGRDRSVDRRPSFHYASDYRWSHGRETDFGVEVIDAAGKVLICHDLHEDCQHCDEDCWPKRIREAVTFPPGAAKLRVLEGDKQLYEEDIPEPPKVQVKCQFVDKAVAFDVQWSATDPQKKADLWYLVQWQDRDGSWRGHGARTQKTDARIKAVEVGWRNEVPLRVLATSGIATGVGECMLELKFSLQSPPPQVVVTSHPKSAGPEVQAGGTIQVTVLDRLGGSVSDPEIFWYDERGGEVGRGRFFDVRQLPAGQHVLRAVAPDRGSGRHDLVMIVEMDELGNCLRFDEAPSEPASGRDTHTHSGPGAVPEHDAPDRLPPNLIDDGGSTRANPK